MQKPWYKQFWPWFLICLPITAVIGSFTTLGIFIENSISLVSEDYYKEGKGVNVDLSKIVVAQGLDIKASVTSTETGITVLLDKGQLPQYPALNVTFVHRTLPDRDFQQTLSSDANGAYRIALDTAITGPWFIKVQPFNQEWLLQGKVTFPTSSPVSLN